MHQVTELKEIQSLALELLYLVDKFCKEQGIDYYLAYGTLIGTVRHHGFIPWDDDIDIWIKREEYRRFIDSVPKWGEDHGVYLNSAQTVPRKYNRAPAQVCLAKTTLIANDRCNEFKEGYFIDIFPLDGTPNNPLHRWLRLTHLQLLKNIATLAAYRGNVKNPSLKARLIAVVASVVKKIDTQKTMLEYEKVASKSKCDDSEYVQVLTPAGRKGRNALIKSDNFDSTIQMSFETITASVPSGYDKILRNIYGDYMQLPPVEARKPHHYFKLYIED